MNWATHGDILDDDVIGLIDALPHNAHVTNIQLQGNAEISDRHMDRLGALVGPNGDRQPGCNPCLGPCAVMRVDLSNTGVDPAKASWVARQIDLRRVSENTITRLDWSTGDVGEQDGSQFGRQKRLRTWEAL